MIYSTQSRVIFGIPDFIPQFPSFKTVAKADSFLTAEQGDRSFFIFSSTLPGHYRLMPKCGKKCRTDWAIGLKASNSP